MQIDWIQLLLQVGALGLLLYLLDRLSKGAQQALELFGRQLETWQTAMIDTAKVLEKQGQLLQSLCDEGASAQQAQQAQIGCLESLSAQIEAAVDDMRKASAAHEANATLRHNELKGLIKAWPNNDGGSEISGSEP